MAKDKVMHPTQPSRAGGTAKQVKSGIIEGPTASSENLNPYSREKKAGEK